MVLSLILILAPAVASADSCWPDVVHPGYAHNDYYNPQPFADAMANGLRGVEVDLFRDGGALLVGHSRSELRDSRTLERLYLRPMAARVARCGPLLPSGASFLLNIELKESDPQAFALLAEALNAFRSMLEAGRVRAILVGWWPERADGWPDYLQPQLAYEEKPTNSAQGTGPPPGLLSVDYSQSLRWNGHGEPSPPAQRELREAVMLAADLGIPLRVHQAPANAAIYRWLLSSGVDLIGFKSVDDVRLLPPAR